MAYHDASHISRRGDSRGRGRSDRDASRDCGRSDAGRDRARSPLSVNLTTKTVRLHNITFAAMGPLLLIVTLRVVRPLGAIPGEKNPRVPPPQREAHLDRAHDDCGLATLRSMAWQTGITMSYLHFFVCLHF